MEGGEAGESIKQRIRERLGRAGGGLQGSSPGALGFACVWDRLL